MCQSRWTAITLSATFVVLTYLIVLNRQVKCLGDTFLDHKQVQSLNVPFRYILGRPNWLPEIWSVPAMKTYEQPGIEIPLEHRQWDPSKVCRRRLDAIHSQKHLFLAKHQSCLDAQMMDQNLERWVHNEEKGTGLIGRLQATFGTIPTAVMSSFRGKSRLLED